MVVVVIGVMDVAIDVRAPEACANDRPTDWKCLRRSLTRPILILNVDSMHAGKYTAMFFDIDVLSPCA